MILEYCQWFPSPCLFLKLWERQVHCYCRLRVLTQPAYWDRVIVMPLGLLCSMLLLCVSRSWPLTSSNPASQLLRHVGWSSDTLTDHRWGSRLPRRAGFGWETANRDALARSSTFRIKCGDAGFRHVSFDVSHHSSTGDQTPSTHGGASCLLHWRQLRQHVVGSLQVDFRWDALQPRLRWILRAPPDCPLHAGNSWVECCLQCHRRRMTRAAWAGDVQGVGVPECEGRAGLYASWRTLSRDNGVVKSTWECCRLQSHAGRELPQGDDPRTDHRKGVHSYLPGWHPKETASKLPSRADCFINATPSRRPDAVVWAPLVGQARWLPPFGDCGSVASCHLTFFFEKVLFFFRKYLFSNLFFVSKKNLSFHMRQGLLARLKALLITASCGDVDERVKSMYVQLSLISSAGHPLHQAVSHFYWSFFVAKKQKEEDARKNAKQKKGKKTEQKNFREMEKHLVFNKKR